MNNNLSQTTNSDVRENVVAGIVGALLFALAGGVIWFVFYLLGFIVGISGLVGAICAIKGYSIFAKKESIKGIVISVVISLLIIVLAWYLCLAYDVCEAYKAWYEEGFVDYTISYFDAVRGAYQFLSDPEIGPAYFGDLAIGLVFCIIGGGSYVVNKIRGVKQQKAMAAPAAEPESENKEDTGSES